MARRRWLIIHRWLALGLGAHWLLLAVTGAALVFHREIEVAWIGASPAQARSLDIDAAIEEVTRRGFGPVKLVVIQNRPTRALRVFSADVIHTVDTTTNRLLSSGEVDGGSSPTGLIRFLYTLHYQLAAGATGKWLVGVSGLLLLVTVIVGLKLGWPRKGTWWRTLKPSLAGKSWQRHYVVHRSVGLLVALALVSATLSGAGMIWGDAIRSLIVRDAAAAGSVEIGAQRIGPRSVGANQAVFKALAQLPGSSFVRVDLPTAQRPSYLVRLREPGEFRPVFGTSIVEIGASDGAVKRVEPASSAPAGKRMLGVMFSLHNGEWLGIAGRLLVLLQGAALAYLSISGLLIWLGRRSRG